MRMRLPRRRPVLLVTAGVLAAGVAGRMQHRQRADPAGSSQPVSRKG